MSGFTQHVNQEVPLDGGGAGFCTGTSLGLASGSVLRAGLGLSFGSGSGFAAGGTFLGSAGA